MGGENAGRFLPDVILHYLRTCTVLLYLYDTDSGIVLQEYGYYGKRRVATLAARLSPPPTGRPRKLRWHHA